VNLYLSCLTQEQIADKIGLTQGRIAQIINFVRSNIEANPPTGAEALLLVALFPPSQNSTVLGAKALPKSVFLSFPLVF